MSAQRAREPRLPVRIGARIKSGRGWRDVVIRNVSARGVMGECESAPARGDYVEVRCGAYVIVARVAWANEGRFGARTQDVIALADLIACGAGRARPTAERRRQPRPTHAAQRTPSFAERAFASGRLGRAFEFGSLIAAGAALATLLGGAAHDALATPVRSISQALTAGAQP